MAYRLAAPVIEDDYDAIVYDLDGTLVRLDVDWDAVARDVDAALAEHAVATNNKDLWGVLEQSIETGHRDIVEEAIAVHERDGAETATVLSLAESLPHEVPVGVVSLNCEAACQRALEVHGLTDHVDVVVGRDSVGSFKPDPEPLLFAIEELGTEPSRSLFVGDSDSDRTTAERAGTDFQWVRNRV